jgi:hypothetical protein
VSRSGSASDGIQARPNAAHCGVDDDSSLIDVIDLDSGAIPHFRRPGPFAAAGVSGLLKQAGFGQIAFDRGEFSLLQFRESLHQIFPILQGN